MKRPVGIRGARSRAARRLAGMAAAFAVVSVAAALVSVGAATGAASAEAASSAEVFAQHVLGEATIPPGARRTDEVSCDGLSTPFDMLPVFSGLIDLHRFYLVDGKPGSVLAYLRSHEPTHASETETNYASGCVAGGLGYVLSVSGPHEYSASLFYALAAVGDDHTELRVDASSIWVPSRPRSELAPTTGVVEVTGYSEVSLLDGSSGPVTFTLGRAEAKLVVSVLNRLPLGPNMSGGTGTYPCMENVVVYKILFRPTRGAPVSFEADGWGCAREVVVSVHGRGEQPVYDKNGALMCAVLKALPAKAAKGSRSYGGWCHS